MSINNAWILTYGYDAATHDFSPVSIQDIFRQAQSFAEQLAQQRSAPDVRISTVYVPLELMSFVFRLRDGQ